MKLAIIPARGGSKRIPRKNIAPFCGKPMIAWSIKVLQESGCVDRVVVSTDDAEIAEIARKYGAETPFVRPAELATDYCSTIPVIRHAVEWYAANVAMPEVVCCLYPTAPFVTPQDLQVGLQILTRTNCDYAFSVTVYASPIQRALRINSMNHVEMLQPEHRTSRTQDLEACYHDAGQFYWGRPAAWLAERPIFSANSAPIILPRYRVEDIDTPEDWARAEWLFKALHSST